MKRNGISDPTHDDETVMNGAPKMVLWVGHPPPCFSVAGDARTEVRAISEAIAATERVYSVGFVVGSRRD